jgi:diguanylate cyclase (GGDEF)-like protein
MGAGRGPRPHRGWRFAPAYATIVRMLADVASGTLLCAGAVAAVAGAARGGVRPVPRLALAVALACAAAADLVAAGDGAASPWLRVTACLAAIAGLAGLVLEHRPDVGRLSRLDAAMGAAAAAALAVALGASAPPAIAAAGVLGLLSLSRWRPGWAVAMGCAGLACLGLTEGFAPAAALLLGAAAWWREPRAQRSPEFSRIVLFALLACAGTALALLTVGQFRQVADVAVVLATLSVVVGAARSGFTVIERLGDSNRRAITDDLTGLGNRRHLVASLDAAVASARGHEGRIALLLVDLDGFKELNDTLGHQAGDEVLRQIGPRLQAMLRDEDTLARLGGDEFAVVLDPGDEASASTAGLRLRAALEDSFAVGGISVHIDASVGIALFPDHAADSIGLLQRADVAMYQAKRLRTGHEVYLPSRDRHSRRRLALVGQLGDALQAGELELHYQPKADLRTGAVRSVEALVRWQHPQHGLLGPAHFLPLVEQSGLTRSLTAFVLDAALEEIGRRRRDGYELSVAVNLGPADLLDLGLPGEVRRLLSRHEFDPQHLQLEVSEDVVMVDIERTVDVLIGLRRTGVEIALDDFGAGNSVLGQLKLLRVDELKIDRSFVMRVGRDPRDAAIVQSIVDLARRLGLRVVAEGVEDAETWALLAGWGCDEAQGHFLGRPMPASQLERWLRGLAQAAPGPADERLWAPVRA